MFIVNLRRNGIVNTLNCLAFKQTGCKIQAVTEQHHPDCPYFITLGEYSSEKRAKKEFARLVEAIRLNKKYYELEDETHEQGI